MKSKEGVPILRAEVFLYIPFVVLSFLLFLANEPGQAQTTDEEIKRVKEQIEILSRRLEELEGQKTQEKKTGDKANAEYVTANNVTFYNSSIDRNMRKLSESNTSRTFLSLSGDGTVSLADEDDPNRVNAVFAPMVKHRITSNLHLVLKPEVKVQNQDVVLGLGMGEVDFFLNDYITLRGGKIQNTAAILTPQIYPSWIGNDPISYSLARRDETMPSQDILSDLQNMGVGISGGIPLKFFEGANINYGISFVNSANGPSTMNFSFSISRQ